MGVPFMHYGCGNWVWDILLDAHRLSGRFSRFFMCVERKADTVGTQLKISIGRFDPGRFITFQPGGEDGCPGTAERVYVPTDFDTKEKALSVAKAAEKGLK